MSALPVAIILAGCGESGPSRVYPLSRDSAGVTIVENDTLPERLTLGPRLYRLGEVDGPRSLHQVRHVFLMAGGGVGVVETSTGLVRFFEERGRPAGEVGGRGEGPGEFRLLWWATRLPGDTLLALDLAYPTTLSVFDPGGGFVRSSVVPRVGSSGELDVLGGWAEGEVVVGRRHGDEDTPPGEVFQQHIYSVDAAGALGKDMGLWPTGVRRDVVQAYPTEASFVAEGSRLLYAPGDRFEIRQFDADGGLQGISRVNRARFQVTRADVDAYMRDEWEPLVARAEGTALERRIRELGEPTIPDSMPAYTSVLADQGGGFWARRGGRRDDPDDVWDVFDAEGVHVGALEVPRRFRPTSLAGAYVAGVALDETDVEFVDVYAWAAADGDPVGAIALAPPGAPDSLRIYVLPLSGDRSTGPGER